MAEESANLPNEEIPVPEPEGALHDNDDIADAFLSLDETEPEQEDKPAPTDEGGDAVSEGTEEVPDPVMPEGWEETLWSAATPEVRAKIAEQVSAHAAAIAAEKKAQAELKAAQDAYAVQANAQLQQALATMKHVIEGEFATVDWQALANTDPAAYVKLQQLYNTRMGAVRQMEQGVAQQVQQWRQAKEAEAQKHIESEFQAVLPEVKALIGAGFDGKTFVNDIAEYLVSQGVPRDALNGMSNGYEVRLATKAMLYDRLISRRASAAQKVAEAPKVSSPSGSKAKAEDDKFAKAMSILKKNPSSTDAIADVFLTL